VNIKLHQIKSVTLIEVLIAMITFSIIILYFTAIESIGRSDLLNADRRAKVQNEAIFLLEHITKNITGTGARGGAIGNTVIGDTSINGQIPVKIDSATFGDNALFVWTDYLDPITPTNIGKRDTGDKQIAYRYRPDTASPTTDRYQMWYYDNYTNYPDSPEVITGNRIRGDFDSNCSANHTCVTYDPSKNYLYIQVTACWDPTEPAALGNCGTAKNPQITVQARTNMPAVATH
jgi:hypothetical protein